jgi:anti-sigma regulatory factor (Ser/Thr protein kinase)
MLASYTGYAQYSMTRHFTTTDGLPSNMIYACVEDNKGFLWIATDNGLARFDGKRFQVFTSEHGLPDNEVLQVVKEKNGRIWANCFNQSPAYFDEVNNRFINEKQNPELSKVKGNGVLLLSAMKDGGVLFTGAYNSSHLYLGGRHYALVKNNLNVELGQFIQCLSDSSVCFVQTRDTACHFYHLKNGVVLKDSSANNLRKMYAKSDYSEQILFLFRNATNKLFVLKNHTSPKIQYSIDSVIFKDPIGNFGFNKYYFSVVNKKAEIEFYDKSTLKHVFTLSGDYTPNSMYVDSKDHIWVTTIDKGLLLYQKQQISSIHLPLSFQRKPSLSVTKKEPNIVHFGNYSGEVVELRSNRSKIHTIHHRNPGKWIRSIIHSQQKVFCFTDGGIFINYRKPLLTYSAIENRFENVQSKAAIALNDSIILSGGINGLFRINAITEELAPLYTNKIRITTLASIDKKDIVYFGSTNGLYKYSLQKVALIARKEQVSILNNRIISLCATQDSLLWVAISGHGIIVMKSDSIVAHLTVKNNLVSNHCITICEGSKGQVWVGSNNGLSIIDYVYSDNFKSHKIKNLYVQDGLNSNIINQMAYDGDTMYVATNSGVCMMPTNLLVPEFDICIKPTRIQINQQDTALLSHYILNPGQRNIQIQFAGIELTGHFKHAQYSLDKGKKWNNLEGNNLNLQLSHGEHPVWFRAVDLNGNKGTKLLKLQFDIAIPFYKIWWFWVLLSFIAIGSCIYYYTCITKRKHEKRISDLLNEQLLVELEMQALKAQINPHFVFNCLNAIKELIFKRELEKAEFYLRKFSALLRETLNYSRRQRISLKEELAYIQDFLLMEKFRFGKRFEFEINVHEDVSQDRITIPAMLLQPFVENALQHGILRLTEKVGHIEIKVYIEDDKLHIHIDDNGIGRTRANEMKQSFISPHESLGMELTKRQMTLHQIELEVIDKISSVGEALGTMVCIKVPTT